MPQRYIPLSLIAIALSATISLAQDSSSTDTLQEELTKILTVQANCWNEEDIEGFMQTYWKSEELTFSSGGKTTRGWQATLDGYKKRYPAGNMGKLHFDHLEVNSLGESSALVLGQWHLTYDTQNRDGNFSLVLRKFDDGWKIIHDHSSLLDEPQEMDDDD